MPRGIQPVDSDAINGVTVPLDWAQAFAQKKATLVAGTGYQYGDTDFLEYSERLYLNFAKELRAGTRQSRHRRSAGQGEARVPRRPRRTFAACMKRRVLEATLFGLPMLGVNMPAGRTRDPTDRGVIERPPSLPPGRLRRSGLRIADLPVSPALTPHTLNLTNYEVQPPTTTTATWLSGPDGVVTNPAEPALPLQVVNVTPTNPALVLRGVGFRGATYSDSTVLPLTGAPTTELRGVHTPFSSPVFFPMRLWTHQLLQRALGRRRDEPARHARAAPGVGCHQQHVASVLGPRPATVLQRPHLRPRIPSMRPQRSRMRPPSCASMPFRAAPLRHSRPRSSAIPLRPSTKSGSPIPSGAGGSGTWTSVNLQQCVAPLPAACGTTTDSQFWKGQVATATLPADTKYIVQAVSGTGLVSLDDNLGRYYSVGCHRASGDNDRVQPAAAHQRRLRQQRGDHGRAFGGRLAARGQARDHCRWLAVPEPARPTPREA